MPRIPSRGCKVKSLSICERMSGEAFRRTQLSPSALIATWSWLRALPGKAPSRSDWQLWQAQFHCGNPPPAAVPSSFTRIQIVHSSAFAYELISQQSWISSNVGLVHSIFGLPRDCTSAARLAPGFHFELSSWMHGCQSRRTTLAGYLDLSGFRSRFPCRPSKHCWYPDPAFYRAERGARDSKRCPWVSDVRLQLGSHVLGIVVSVSRTGQPWWSHEFSWRSSFLIAFFLADSALVSVG